MKSTKTILSSIVMATLFLTACNSNDIFVREAKSMSKESQKQKVQEQQKLENEDQRIKDFYKERERPIQEDINELEKESVKILENQTAVQKDVYENQEEFAKYVAKVLYDFQTSQITAEKYYQFMNIYGSETIKKDLPQKEDAIAAYNSIQSAFQRENFNGDSYKLTEVILDRFKRDGYFYRKVISTDGISYYITSITKEEEGWKFVSDGSSIPFEEE